jgi:hypothetical protein
MSRIINIPSSQTYEHCPSNVDKRRYPSHYSDRALLNRLHLYAILRRLSRGWRISGDCDSADEKVSYPRSFERMNNDHVWGFAPPEYPWDFSGTKRAAGEPTSERSSKLRRRKRISDRIWWYLPESSINISWRNIRSCNPLHFCYVTLFRCQVCIMFYFVSWFSHTSLYIVIWSIVNQWEGTMLSRFNWLICLFEIPGSDPDFNTEYQPYMCCIFFSSSMQISGCYIKFMLRKDVCICFPISYHHVCRRLIVWVSYSLVECTTKG